jgi:hypothetical protein
MSDTTTKPQVWSDENGDYFAQGHVDPETFKTAAHAHDVYCLGADHVCEDGECSAEMEPDEVEHGWWYPVDPTNEEAGYHTCTEDHPGAEPFTAWTR